MLVGHMVEGKRPTPYTDADSNCSRQCLTSVVCTFAALKLQRIYAMRTYFVFAKHNLTMHVM